MPTRRLSLLPALALCLLCAALLRGTCAQKAKDWPSPTPPPAEAPAPLAGARVFCVFGDTRPDGDPRRLNITRRVAAAMAAERPAFALGTGDYIDGARTTEAIRKQYEAFFQALSPLQRLGPVSLAAAPGNHDVSGGSGDLFTKLFGQRYYSFELGQAHLIVLDTEQPGAHGRIDGLQWDWLCRDLTRAQSSRLIFVVLHQPLFPVSVHRGSSLDKYPKYRDRLHLLFAQARVNAVFCGHEHLYNHQKRDGVNYFITAGAGAPLYASPARGGFYHYLRVSFTDTEYEVAPVRVD